MFWQFYFLCRIPYKGYPYSIALSFMRIRSKPPFISVTTPLIILFSLSRNNETVAAGNGCLFSSTTVPVVCAARITRTARHEQCKNFFFHKISLLLYVLSYYNFGVIIMRCRQHFLSFDVVKVIFFFNFHYAKV